MGGAMLSLMVLAAEASGPLVSGGQALALGTIVAPYAQSLSPAQVGRLNDLLNQRPVVARPRETLVVRLDQVQCRGSNVDISAFECTLVAGKKSKAVSGRLAHEIIATLAEAGVEADAGAGSVYWRVKALSCTIRPADVLARDGGGAECRYRAET